MRAHHVNADPKRRCSPHLAFFGERYMICRMISRGFERCPTKTARWHYWWLRVLSAQTVAGSQERKGRIVLSRMRFGIHDRFYPPAHITLLYLRCRLYAYWRGSYYLNILIPTIFITDPYSYIVEPLEPIDTMRAGICLVSAMSACIKRLEKRIYILRDLWMRLYLKGAPASQSERFCKGGQQLLHVSRP